MVRYGQLVTTLLHPHSLSYCIFFVTARCNYRCKMCFYWKEIDDAEVSKELSLEEIQKIAENMPHLFDLNLTGGEPFLREDLADVVRAFYERSRLRFITIPTNGSMPERIADTVKRIHESCPDLWLRITLSLDEIGEMHDEIRGVKGAFERTMETHDKLAEIARRRTNLSLGVATVFSRYNQNRISEIHDFIEKRLNVDSFGVLLARGNTREKAAVDVDLEKYVEAVREAHARVAGRRRGRSLYNRMFNAMGRSVSNLIVRTVLENRAVLPCVAGRRMVVIGPTGEVRPCEMLGTLIENEGFPLDTDVMGNLRDVQYDVRRILASDTAGRIVSAIREQRCYCSFECAATANIAFNARAYPGLLKNLFRA